VDAAKLVQPRFLLQALVRKVTVIVAPVFGQDPSEMPLADQRVI
jgi:hypothetical protein